MPAPPVVTSHDADAPLSHSKKRLSAPFSSDETLAADSGPRYFPVTMTDLMAHPFLQTQLVYDHAPEAATIPPYTRALWDRMHRLIGADIARFKPAERVRLLDVGCGPGHIADSQAEHISSYVGVDPSLIELRRGRQLPGRCFVHGIAERLDFITPGSFDLVTLVSVLDHCIDWRRALDNCAAALRPGGVMLIAMENAEQLPSRVRRWLGREVEHQDHMHFISLPDLATALGERFMTLKTTTFGYGFGLHGLTARARLPRQLFDMFVPAMDRIGQAALPNAGQVLYACYRKNAEAANPKGDSLFRRRLPSAGGIYDALAT